MSRQDQHSRAGRTIQVLADGARRIGNKVRQKTADFLDKVDEPVNFSIIDTHQTEEEAFTDARFGRASEEANDVVRERGKQHSQSQFFSSIKAHERTPVVLTATTRSHPDTMLRRLGLIEQLRSRTRRRQGDIFKYSPHLGQWYSTTVKQDDIVPDSVNENKMRRIADEAPPAVILVCGAMSMDMPRVVAAGSSQMKDAEAEQDRLLREIERQHERLKSGKAGDAANYTPGEQVALVKQLLSRAVPAAAHSTGALIVCGPGDGPVAAHIGAGIAARQGLRTGERSEKVIKALAVTPYSDKQGYALARNFTHHLVLRRCTKSSHRRCRGFQCAPEVAAKLTESDGGAEHQQSIPGDTPCVWCQDPAYKHSPNFLQVRSLQQHRRLPAASEIPTSFETDMFVSRLVDNLAVGNSSHLDKKGRTAAVPPVLPAVPVCVLLIGGDEDTAHQQLVQFIQRKYTILVVEGSGGYADMLCMIKKRIEVAFPHSGREKLQQLTTALDPLTAEVLCSSDQVRFIRIGAKSEELVRIIEGSLKGDRALMNTWRTFSLWRSNAKLQRRLFHATHLSMLLLNVLTTLFTVVQTFLILWYKANGEGIPPTIPEPVDERGEVVRGGWSFLQWSVIILPICISVVQGIMNQWHFGARWVELRTCSERLLSEIYMYRAGALAYKDEEIEKQRKEGRAASFASKEDVLQEHTRQLTELLLNGHCRTLTLVKYRGEVPPRRFLLFDDGTSWLQPDQYVRVRLNVAIDRYASNARNADRFVMMMRILGYLMSALGTSLAAIAAYSEGSVQAWVALTTAMLNGFTRWLEYTRAEFMLKKYNTTVMQLRNVGAWWASLGSRADTTENRDLLVSQVEGLVTDEVDSWAQQIHGVLEHQGDARDSKGRRDGAGSSGSSGGAARQEDANAMKELGLELLSADHLLTLMSDTMQLEGSSEAAQQQIRKLAKKIANKGTVPASSTVLSCAEKKKAQIEGLKQAALAEIAHADEQRTKRGETLSVLHKIRFPPFAKHDLSSVDPLLFLDHTLREQLLARLLRVPGDALPHRGVGGVELFSTLAAAKKTGLQQIMRAIEGVPQLSSAARSLGHVEVLAMIKQFVLEELFSEFISATRAFELRRDAVFSTPSQLEDFISEFASIARIPSSIKLSATQVIALVQDHSVQTRLMGFRLKHKASAETIISAFRQVALRTLVPHEPLFVLLNSLMRRIAELDIDLVMCETKNALVLAKAVEELEQFATDMGSLSKSDFVARFPKELRHVVAGKSQLQIEHYFAMVFERRISLRTVSAFTIEFGSFVPKELLHLLKSREQQLRLICAAESVTQVEIMRAGKATLLRRIRASPLHTRQLEEVLLRIDDRRLRSLMSGLQAKGNTTFSAEVVDRVADYILTFDLRKLMDFEDCSRLVARLSDFALIEDLRTLSKEQIMLAAGFQSLAQTLDTLSVPQLVELLSRLRHAHLPSWALVAQVKELVSLVPDIVGPEARPEFSEVTRTWESQTFQRLFWLAGSLRGEASFHHNSTSTTSPAFIEASGDNVVMQAVRNLPHNAVRSLFTALQQVSRDYETVRVFERAVEAPALQSNFSLLVRLCSVREVRNVFLSAALAILRTRQSFAFLIDMDESEFRTTLIHVIRDDVPQIFREFGTSEGTPTTTKDRAVEVAGRVASLLDGTSSEQDCPSLDNESFKSFFLNLVTELVLSSPRRVFYRLAKRCRCFDLKEVFGSVEERCDLVALLYLALDSLAALIAEPMSCDTDERFELDMLGLPCSDEDTAHPAGRWKRQMIAAMLRLFEPHGYASVVTKLHAFTEAQLRFICVSMGSVTQGLLGRFFAATMDRQAAMFSPRDTEASDAGRQIDTLTGGLFDIRPVDPRDCTLLLGIPIRYGGVLESLREVCFFNTAIDALRQLAIHDPEDVRSHLDRFDANKFERRNVHEKSRLLAKVMHVGSDKPLKLLSCAKADQLARLFALLRNAMAPEGSNASPAAVVEDIERRISEVVAPPAPTSEREDATV